MPNAAAEVEEALVCDDVSSPLPSPSPTLTGTSDYTMSSQSVDDHSPSEHNNLDAQYDSFNGGLGQWDIVENAGYGPGLLFTGGLGGDNENKPSGTQNFCERSKALQITPQDQLGTRSHSPQNDDDRSATAHALEDFTTPSQSVCLFGDDVHYDAREDFDIVYDIFYQDENFELYEGFMVTEEDLHNAVRDDDDDDDDVKAHGNLPEDESGGSATPPLERVESPEISSRATVKSLPSVVSACRSVEDDCKSFSCQGLSTRVPGMFVRDAGCEDEFLSFSRRDFAVLRKSLQELQVGMFQKQGDGFDIGPEEEEVQEDLALTSGIVKELEEEEGKVSVLKGFEQTNGTSANASCQEMMTQQERQVRPLSAARVLRPLSSSVVLGFQQSPRDHHVRENRVTFVGSAAVTPALGFQGAEKDGESSMMMSGGGKPPHLERKKVKCVVVPEMKVIHLFNRRSMESSQGSSYATPRTGISADELESSVSRKNVPSRSDLHDDDTAEGSILELLSAKVQLLDVNQQKYLLQVLNKIERAKQSGNLNIPSMFASLERPWMGMGVHLTSPEGEGAPRAYLIVLRILSTWGDAKCVGLVEVSLAQAPELINSFVRRIMLRKGAAERA